MFTIVVVSVGLIVGTYRCVKYKKNGGTSNKVRYYDYSKYIIRHKKNDISLSRRSKDSM